METTTACRQLNATEQSNTATNGSEYALKVVLAYEDDQTRQWAKEVCAQVEQLVGAEAIRSTWLNLRNLNQSAVLAGAVSRAKQSDVIVVAVRAAAGLPLAFYHWADTWLPQRSGEPGALVALVGLTEQTQAEPDGTLEYLRALSRREQMDFMAQQRRLPAVCKQRRSLGVAAAAPVCAGE